MVTVVTKDFQYIETGAKLKGNQPCLSIYINEGGTCGKESSKNVYTALLLLICNKWTVRNQFYRQAT